MDLKCRCRGRGKNDPCIREADEEDGLCEPCRHRGVVLRWDGYKAATCCEDIPEADYDMFLSSARYANAMGRLSPADRHVLGLHLPVEEVGGE